jgi:hypothetical protein
MSGAFPMRTAINAALIASLWEPSAHAQSPDETLPPLPAPTPAASAPAVTTPPPPETSPSSPMGCSDVSRAHCHDGFYFRLALGPAFASLWGNGPQGNASISGPADAVTLALGATIAKHVVLAAALHNVFSAGTFSGAPNAATGTAFADMLQLGLLVDWYPVSEAGWHVGSVMGLGGSSLVDASGSRSASPGLAASLLGGYDWWIGPQWSLGALLALSTATAGTMSGPGQPDTGYTFTPFAFALEVSLLNH